jgi:hypothetical protein
MTDRDEPTSRTDGGDAGAEESPPRRGGTAARHLDLDQIAAYLGRELPTADQRAAAAHLAACVDCRREAAELRATVGLLRGLPQYAPRRSFRLGPEHAHPVGPAWVVRLLPALPALRLASGAVAALLLLVSVGGFVSDRGAAPGFQSTSLEAPQSDGAPSTAGGAAVTTTAPPAAPAPAPAQPTAALPVQQARSAPSAGAANGGNGSAIDPVAEADEGTTAMDGAAAGAPAPAGPAAASGLAEAETDLAAGETAGRETAGDRAGAPTIPPATLLPGAAPDPAYSTQVAAGAAPAPTPSPVAAPPALPDPGSEPAAPPFVSGWRRAQLGLALLLIPLLAALAAAEWMRLRTR